MKFLIVDDQPTCRMTLNFILRKLGHETTLCASQSLQQTNDRIQKEVEDFRLGEPQDDISLLGIEIG